MSSQFQLQLRLQTKCNQEQFRPHLPSALRCLLCLAFAWGLALAGHAQVETDEGAIISTTEGFSIERDSLFLLNLRFRMQNRVGVRSRSVSDLTVQEIEARVRRLRLRFDGFVGSPAFQYYIQLSFSRADQDFDDSGQVKIIRDAMAYYHFNPRFYLGFGQSKLPSNRQRVTSSGNMQFADRSLANSAFTLDRDFGLFAYYTLPIPAIVKLKAALSTGEGRNINRTDAGLAYTIRGEWLPFGAFIDNGDYFEGDLAYEPTPKLALGTTLSHNDRTTNSGGQLGMPLLRGIDLTTWILDAAFKFRGHACVLEWMSRESSVLGALSPEGELLGVPMGKGLNVQYSYTTRSMWEGAIRYSEVRQPASGLLDSQRELLFGFNKYFNQHRIKAQGHIGYREAFKLPEERSWLVAMFQVEFGI